MWSQWEINCTPLNHFFSFQFKSVFHFSPPFSSLYCTSMLSLSTWTLSFHLSLEFFHLCTLLFWFISLFHFLTIWHSIMLTVHWNTLKKNLFNSHKSLLTKVLSLRIHKRNCFCSLNWDLEANQHHRLSVFDSVTTQSG